MKIPLQQKHKRISVVLLCFFLMGCGFGKPRMAATKGVLDLHSYNWQRDGIIDVNGEWKFYWNALYTPAALDTATSLHPVYAVVPGFWNSVVPYTKFLQPAFGYATYSVKIVCPVSSPALAIKFLTVASAYKLFVNGKQIGGVGKVGTSGATTIAAFQPVIFTVTPVNNELNIVVQVSNFSYNSGGLWDFIKLGTEHQISNYKEKTIAEDYFIAGSFFIIGIFYLVIYFFFSRRLSPLYFSFFCLLIGVRSLVTGELNITYLVNLNWQFVKHAEFISLYLIVPVVSLFSYDLFPNEFSKKVLRWVLLISLPFVAISVFATPFVFRYTLRPFQLFMLIMACYGFYVYTQAVKNKRTGGIYLLAGFIILVLTAINDILYNSLIIQSTNLIYFGLYIFIICQAASLSKQFFRAFIKEENLNEELEKINDELKEKNNTINEANEQLNKLNAELDTLVFRTSHDLKSPITSVYSIADMIKWEKDENKRAEYIDFQKRTLLRLNALINEILDYAKNKSTALYFEEINWNEFIQHALQDHSFSEDSETIKRIVEITQPCAFASDKVRLSIVLNNIISNALKYHNKRQEQPYLKICVQVSEQQALIEVTDNGQGIGPEHLNHIFDKFYRASTKQKGSGFGLYLVKEAVEKLGGKIRVESKIHEGTRFFITVPNGAN